MQRRNWPRLGMLLVALLPVNLALAEPFLELKPDVEMRIELEGPPSLALATEPLAEHLQLVFHRSIGGDGGVVFKLIADAAVWSELPDVKKISLAELNGFSLTIDARQSLVTIHGRTVLGASFGVYHFLEKHIGVQWLFPGELGTELPSSAHILLEAGEWQITPDVASRLFTGLAPAEKLRQQRFRKAFKSSPLFAQRHHFEAHDYFRSLKLDNLFTVSHNMINIFPETIGDTEPELLPLQADGTRYRPPRKQKGSHRHQNWHPCYTHAAAARIAVEKARQSYDAGTLCFSLGINDGHRVQCQCQNCEAVGWPASYYQFVDQVATRLTAYAPPHLVGTIVYGDVRQPPPNMKLPGNVIAMLAGPASLDRWSQHAQLLGKYDYFYGLGFWVPNLPLASMKHNARLYREANVQSFRAEAHPMWAFDAPKLWIWSRVLFDMELDIDQALDEFCRHAYGEGAPAMAAVYRRFAACWDDLVDPDKTQPAAMASLPCWRDSNLQLSVPSVADYEFAEGELAVAKGLVGQREPKHRERIEMVACHLGKSRALFEANRLAQALFAADNLQRAKLWPNLAGVAERLASANEQIAHNTAWRLAQREARNMPGWTVENELKAACLTALMTAEPRPPAPADWAWATAKPAGRRNMGIEVLTSGHYYLLPENARRFARLSAAVKNGALQCQSVDDAEAPTQVAVALLARTGHHGRSLMALDVDLEARDGDLELHVSPGWQRRPEDGLPIAIRQPFTEPQTLRRTIYVEPIAQGTAKAIRSSQLRFVVKWTPKAPKASLLLKAKSSQINYPDSSIADEPEVDLEFELEE